MSNTKQKIGLVLGGGGVKGLAHIALLKKLDELNIRPSLIAGTSMGAIIGALYSTGLSGNEIEHRVKDHIVTKGEKGKQIYKKRRQLLKWAKVFSFNKSRGGLFKADGLFEYLFTEIVDKEFSELEIPFTAVATNFYTGEEVALKTGSLLPAVQASMAVPGIFSPIEIDDQFLIDGGTVNNLPCRHVINECDTLIASDVISLPRHENPRTKHVLSGALSIMLSHSTAQQIKKYPPDILFQPDTDGIDAFDFHKINHILERGENAVSLISQQLLELS